MRWGIELFGVCCSCASSNTSLSLLLPPDAMSSLLSWILSVCLFTKTVMLSLLSSREFSMLQSWYLTECSSCWFKSLLPLLCGDRIGSNSNWYLFDLDPPKLKNGAVKGKYEENDFPLLENCLAYTFKNFASQPIQ